MAVDMEALKASDPEAHAYILTLRGEAAANRVEANEWKAKFTTAEAQVAPLTQERDTLAQAKAKLEQDVRVTTQDSWRAAAALKHGLTDAQAKRLQGDTAEALMADAEEFAKDVVPAKRAPAPLDPTLNQPDPEGDGGNTSAESQAFGQALLERLGHSQTP